jgi:hypothetical protein
MKMIARPILRRFGFRRVLISNAIISGGTVAIYGLFRPEDSYLVIMGLLFFGGIARSLQFTSVNTLAVADIPPEQMSRATSFSSMMQQLSLSFGVGIGALSLHITLMLAGGRERILPADFTPAFAVVGCASALSALIFLALTREAGAEVSGHRLFAPTQRLRQGEPLVDGESGAKPQAGED